MTEKRIRRIAVKLWKAFYSKSIDSTHVQRFEDLTGDVQAGWLSAARIAVDEVQLLEATKLLKDARQLISVTKVIPPSLRRRRRGRIKSSPKSCRIDARGKRVCK